jgi:small GTP-binding protein
MYEGEKKSVKVVFAGERNVGKTTLIHRLLTGESVANSGATLAASHSGTLVCAEHPTIELLLWDTAGQER